MFRAIAALMFIVLILPMAALVAALVMKALGVTGVLGFIVGFPVFVAILTGSVVVLATINDRINNKARFHHNRQSTTTKSAH